MKEQFKVFDNYVKVFDIEEPKILGKWQHSYRVRQTIDMLARTLHLGEEDIYLANIIGLLHDIGRFKQWTEYHTFSTSKSIDHGDYACRLLFEENLIEQFQIDKKYYKIIEIAIRNHNKLKIEDGLTEKELLHSKLIRDADKIDIFYNIACLKGIAFPRLEDSITKQVDEQFWKHESVFNKDIQNTNDEVIRLFLSYMTLILKKV